MFPVKGADFKEREQNSEYEVEKGVISCLPHVVELPLNEGSRTVDNGETVDEVKVR